MKYSFSKKIFFVLTFCKITIIYIYILFIFYISLIYPHLKILSANIFPLL
ncbi:unnamed protein product [Meloidogyne enterolobii]|uniref:Uncharacterized protein n=1 Tax=Meloidogyne enterolobii TaxID=390850 RepID=A0ACB0Y9G2_MELEN